MLGRERKRERERGREEKRERREEGEKRRGREEKREKRRGEKRERERERARGVSRSNTLQQCLVQNPNLYQPFHSREKKRERKEELWRRFVCVKYKEHKREKNKILNKPIKYLFSVSYRAL